MSQTLNTREGLKRAFFRILGLSPTDEAISEMDSVVNETANYFIQHGLWLAQYFIVTNTDWHRWVTRQQIESVSGTDNTPDGRYVELRDDFLRLNSSDEVSGLFDSNDRTWGSQIDPRQKRLFSGNFFWIENDRIRFTPGANIPSNLYYEYIFRHPELGDDKEDIDFPTEIRPLIVAEAANMALSESWLPMTDRDTERRIRQNLADWRRVAASKARRTRRPQQLRGESNPYGHNWM